MIFYHCVEIAIYKTQYQYERGLNVKTSTGIYPNLNAEIARHNLSAEKLADIIGTNKTSVWRKLRGHTEFKLVEIVALRDYFSENGLNYTLDYLFSKGGE